MGRFSELMKLLTAVEIAKSTQPVLFVMIASCKGLEIPELSAFSVDNELILVSDHTGHVVYFQRTAAGSSCDCGDPQVHCMSSRLSILFADIESRPGSEVGFAVITLAWTLWMQAQLTVASGPTL